MLNTRLGRNADIMFKGLKTSIGPGTLVAHVCNPSDSGVTQQEGTSLKPDLDKYFMRPYLKNPITETDWNSVSRSESTCLASMWTRVQNNYKKSKQNNKRRKKNKKTTLIGQEGRHQEDQGGKPIQGNSLHNSISKITAKNT
jgi:hypothetical protein